MGIILRRYERWEVPLLAATAGMAIAAMAMLFSGVHYMNGISKSAENNVIYEVMTTSPELTRLQATIAARFLPGTTVTDDEVALRFDIVRNRMTVLGMKESRDLRQDSAEATELLRQMQDAVRSAIPSMENLRSPADAIAVLRFFEPLNSKASRLAALTTSDSATRIAANERKLAEIFWILLAEILGLLVCGIIVIVLLHRARQTARHSAEVDSLTGLANRLSFNRALKETFASAGGPGSMAVLMFDLDLFKHVNDTLGHAAGDELLRSVAARLRPAFGEAELFARLGGDEFAAIFLSPLSEDRARRSAVRIVEAFTTPFDLGKTEVKVSASAGIGVISPADAEPDDLLKKADLALYAVKDDQRGSFRFYDTALTQAFVTRQTLAKDLERAVERNELGLVFQPIVCLKTRHTRSFEALLRWRHPARGPISPADFIPIAEETGLIRPIGRWVIEEACRAAACWPAEVGLTVNLSARQFGEAGLAGGILASLARHGLHPSRLSLEITETTLIQDDGAVLETLNALRSTGIRMALDDFGTGYASLSYLTRFPFDTIKIDQSFVRGSSSQPNSHVIVQAIVDMARKMGLRTVAEGIETEEHAAMALAAGCDKGQGFLFDRPLSEVDCATRLALEQITLMRLPPSNEDRIALST